MKKLLFSAILAFTLVNLTAQVLTRSTDKQTVDNSIKMNKIAMIKTFNLPKFDVEKLLAEDEVDKAAGLPFRFGHISDVNLGTENCGEWVEMAEGRVWVLKISSVGAYSINLVYDKFYLPKGSHLYIYNSDKTALQGPITSEHNTQDRQFATDLIPGSAIILEYFEPYGVEEKGVISVSRVVHGYINLFSNTSKGFGSSASCNIDINCPQGQEWLAESNAVAMIIVGSNRICSGALINNVCQNFIPYFLTANHCIQNQNVGNWTFRFGYISPTCGGGDDYSYYSYFGSTLRANAAISDFALLELNQNPLGNTGITYAGWNRNVNGITQTTIIHHPQGDVMKISFDNHIPVFDNFLGALCWRLGLDQGATEPGSSGAPYFDQNHRIIAQHYGINDGHLPVCQRVNKFGGRFDVSWNNGLAAWLDPNNTGAMTTNTVSFPYISGSSPVCSSNTPFTLSSIPDGTTVTWSHDPNLLTYVSGQGTLTYTVKAINSIANGLGWVRATLIGPCGEIVLPNYNAWVGKPNFRIISDEVLEVKMPGIAFIANENHDPYSVQGVSRIDWSYTGPLTNFIGGLRKATFRAGNTPGQGYIYANAFNSCGATENRFYFQVVESFILNLSPNPALNQIEVTITDSDAEENNIVDPKYMVSIVDGFGSVGYRNIHRGKKFTVNITQIPKGLHTISIEREGKICSATFIKE